MIIQLKKAESGFINYNNPNQQASSSMIYLSHLTYENIDIEVFYNQTSQLNDLYLHFFVNLYLSSLSNVSLSQK